MEPFSPSTPPTTTTPDPGANAAASLAYAERPAVYVRWARRAMRIVFASGFVALGVAAGCAVFETQDWIRNPLYDACVYVGLGVLACWAVAEVLLLMSSSLTGWRLRVWLVFVSLAAVSTAWLYVLPAALHARGVAKQDTWHLLPLFAVMQSVFWLIAISGVSGLVIALISLLMSPFGRPNPVPGTSTVH